MAVFGSGCAWTFWQTKRGRFDGLFFVVQHILRFSCLSRYNLYLCPGVHPLRDGPLSVSLAHTPHLLTTCSLLCIKPKPRMNPVLPVPDGSRFGVLPRTRRHAPVRFVRFCCFPPLFFCCCIGRNDLYLECIRQILPRTAVCLPFVFAAKE